MIVLLLEHQVCRINTSTRSVNKNIIESVGIWNGRRLAVADLLRGLAAVCIVWHHLSLYAPQSDLADAFAPRIGYALYNHGLYAVAVFLVLGGLTGSIEKGHQIHRASSLGKESRALRELIVGLVSRYARLAVPYLVMLALLLSTAWFTNRIGWRLDQVESFSWPQFVAHLFFLQDLLGYDHFSAGTWYLCIEFQWSCFLLLVSYGVNRWGLDASKSLRVRATLLFLLGVSSAWIWSRSSAWESSFLFFASQYVLGIFLGWTIQRRVPMWVLVLYGLSIAGSVWINPRPQIVVSLIVAAVLYGGFRWFSHWRLPACVRWLSDVSYSLFLVHYLVNGVVLKAIDPWASQSPIHAVAAMAIAFACSLVVAAGFYRVVESPTQAWLKRSLVKDLSRPAVTWPLFRSVPWPIVRHNSGRRGYQSRGARRDPSNPEIQIHQEPECRRIRPDSFLDS